LKKRSYLNSISRFNERYKLFLVGLARIDLFYVAATKRGKLYVFITAIKESKFCRHLAHQTVAPRLASECLESERGIAIFRTRVSRRNKIHIEDKGIRLPVSTNHHVQHLRILSFL